jgi:hypothetical protein
MKPLLTSARCLGGAALLVLLPVSSLPSLAAATTVSPYFQSFVFGGIDRDSNGGYPFEDLFIKDHRSNSAPASLSDGRTITADGATMQGAGQSTYSGLYAARNYATMRVSNAQAPHTYYVVSGQGSSSGVRFFTDEAAAANAVFTWRVTGTASNPSTSGTATSRLDFGAKVGTPGDWNDLFGNPSALGAITGFGPGTYTYSLPVADLGSAIYLYFWSSAFAEVNPGEFLHGSTFDLTANFASTFVLEDVDLVDALTGDALSSWTMELEDRSETLFDQTGRIAPIEAAPPPPNLPPIGVPAPGSLVLALAGLMLLGKRWRVTPVPRQRTGASSSATA